MQLLWKQNVVGIRYAIRTARPRQVRLGLLPFFSIRDFHGLRHQHDTQFNMWSEARQVKVSADSNTVTVQSDAGDFQAHPDWWYSHYYSIENNRGMDDTEDLYTPGRFVLESQGGLASITLWASLGGSGPFDWNVELKKRITAFDACHTAPSDARPANRPMLASSSKSLTIKRLVRAANDFIVYRKMPSGQEGSTVIAGYPWFADWGRDTMISLPGLLLVTGRFEQAKQVLSVFAQYCSEGMIPNRFRRLHQ